MVLGLEADRRERLGGSEMRMLPWRRGTFGIQPMHSKLVLSSFLGPPLSLQVIQ